MFSLRLIVGSNLGINTRIKAYSV